MDDEYYVIVKRVKLINKSNVLMLQTNLGCEIDHWCDPGRLFQQFLCAFTFISVV